MNKKLITKMFIAFSMLTTLSFANEMNHGKKSHHKTMKENNVEKTMSNSSSSIKMDTMNDKDDDAGMMMKKSGNKASKMSCGAGKCGGGK